MKMNLLWKHPEGISSIFSVFDLIYMLPQNLPEPPSLYSSVISLSSYHVDNHLLKDYLTKCSGSQSEQGILLLCQFKSLSMRSAKHFPPYY